MADPTTLGCDIPLVELVISHPDAIGRYLELKLLSHYRVTIMRSGFLRSIILHYEMIDKQRSWDG